MADPLNTEPQRAVNQPWMFYHDGVFEPGTEAELRDFTHRLGIFSDTKGIASVVMSQMWEEIDALRVKLANAEKRLARIDLGD